jgi:predicted RNA-binding Zn ribbon-like protein
VDAPCLDLMNSLTHDWRGRGADRDHLDDPAWRAEFCARWGLGDALPGDGPAWAALRRLRALLLDAVDALVRDGRLPAGQVSALNALMGAVAWQPRLTGPDPDGTYTLTEEPAGGAASARVALSFARLIAEGEPGRLRRCANPDCRWVFYDSSKNRSRRFCEPSTCGNLMKVRRFRSRHRHL